MTVAQKLLELRDEKNADFQSKLTPGTDRELFLGIKTPILRKTAKELRGTAEKEQFLQELPHKYFDENMLHSVFISEVRDYDETVSMLEAFLPFIDNWAVCDTLRPAVFGKHKAELMDRIRVWIASEHAYTCRFGIEMLMTHYLDEDFRPEYLELPAGVDSEEYYVNMMLAWFYATALAKQWDAVIPYLENSRLKPWVHNKTIQKARESFRITAVQKVYLKNLKRQIQ